MASSSWSRSARRPPPRPRPPADALAVALAAAAAHWQRLTGSVPPLTDTAAAAVVTLALALWPSIAADLAGEDDPEGA